MSPPGYPSAWLRPRRAASVSPCKFIVAPPRPEVSTGCVIRPEQSTTLQSRLVNPLHQERSITQNAGPGHRRAKVRHATSRPNGSLQGVQHRSRTKFVRVIRLGARVERSFQMPRADIGRTSPTSEVTPLGTEGFAVKLPRNHSLTECYSPALFPADNTFSSFSARSARENGFWMKSISRPMPWNASTSSV